MEITTANSDNERVAVQDFLGRHIDIAPDAVPMTRDDWIYRPLVPLIRDSCGQVIAAALTCRCATVAAAVTAEHRGLSHPDLEPYLRLKDKHSELDLLAVDPRHRSDGLGSSLLAWMETRLALMDVRVWFGHVTEDLDAAKLRRFYGQHGFTITAPGYDLPPLLGQRWMSAMSDAPAFHFYKRPQEVLGRQQQIAGSSQSGV